MRRLAILAISVVAACDDDGGGSIPVETYGNAVASTTCNLYVTCGLLDDASLCEIDFDLGNADLIAAVEAGKVIYHPETASACLASIASAGCRKVGFGLAGFNETCDSVFEGTIGDGGTCALDAECISQACITPSCGQACCQGTCMGGTAPVWPTIGQSCADRYICAEGYCDSATAICTPFAANGSPCNSDGECESDLCSSVCTARPTTGQPCLYASDCDLVSDTCSSTSMTCVPVGLTGDPCTGIDGLSSDCSPIYVCPSGTCELHPRPGEPCDLQNVICLRGYCDPATSTCMELKADGSPCSADDECASDNCDSTLHCSTPPICI